jgi:hypothetical protein
MHRAVAIPPQHRLSLAHSAAFLLYVYMCVLFSNAATVMKPHCVRDEKIALETEK